MQNEHLIKQIFFNQHSYFKLKLLGLKNIFSKLIIVLAILFLKIFTVYKPVFDKWFALSQSKTNWPKIFTASYNNRWEKSDSSQQKININQWYLNFILDNERWSNQ